MLSDIGMVGRALEGDIQRYLQVEFAGPLHQRAKIVQRSQLRMDRFMAALFGTDRPWASDIVRVRCEGAVLSLPISAPDRMDRRKVKNVETHLCDSGQPALNVLERAVNARLVGGRPRE